MTCHYSLDSLAVRGCRLFGWGFCLDPLSELKDGKLLLPLVDGRWHEIALLPGGYREDLVLSFPDVPHAGAAGFMLRATLPASPAGGEAKLCFRRAEEWIELPLPGFPDAFALPQTIPVRSVFQRFLQIRRQRGWGAALKAALRGGMQRLAGLRMLNVRWPTRSVILLDHGMGGGATRYGESRLAFWLSSGRTVVKVVPQASTLDFRIEIYDGSGRSELSVPSQNELLEILERLDADVLEINSLVGFEDVPAVTAWASVWRRARQNRHLRFNLHDFHSVCPAFTLVDSDGRFCGVPKKERCVECLPKNAISTLGLDIHRDIAEWRGAWRDLLAACDHIAAFSMPSVTLLRRAHPELRSGQVGIVGHEGGGKGLRRVAPAKVRPGVVAVLGHINRAKGADLLRALAEASEISGRPLEFIVFGTLEGGGAGLGSLRVLGSYTRETLCDRIEAAGVSLALLPSVCPETYSYVVDEIMEMGLPLAVLDRGAPPERVRHYPLGRVLKGDDPSSLFIQLLEFSEALRK
mgnify:CR=1 FL=1